MNIQKQNMSTNVEGQVSAQIDTKQMLAVVPVGLNDLAKAIHANTPIDAVAELELQNFKLTKNVK